jgi:hypothetical protein
MRRALFVAALCALAGAAQAQSIGTPGVSTPGGGLARIAPSAGGPVGTALSSAGTPAGSTYQWLRGGSAISGATASTYTTVTADGGQTVSLQVKLPGVSITTGGGGSPSLDFSQSTNSQFIL